MPITDTAPYGTATGITKVMETYRETGLGGAPITVQLVTRLSMGGEVARRVVLSLRLLELIDDEGKATANFVAFKQAPSGEYRELFANLLLEVYAPIFAVLGRRLNEKSSAEIEDAFRTFKQDSLRGRMVTCFLGLCEYAGLIEPSGRPTVVAKPKARPAVQVRPKQVKGEASPAETPPSLAPLPSGTMRRTVALRSGGQVTLEVVVDLFALDDYDDKFVKELVAKVKGYGERPALPVGSVASRNEVSTS